MEPVASVVDKLKGFGKSSQDFFAGLIQRNENSARRNPIEILKRLQREAFADLMKLRDRQDKVERMISFYRSSKGSPFQETSTHVRGEVDVLGAILMMDNVDQQNFDALSRAGIRSGIDSRFIFETTLRQRDTLTAEFVASKKGKEYLGDVFGSPLSLTKVCYMANASDWLSVAAIPIGAQCRDVGIATSSSHLGKGLTDFSSFGPPMLTQHNGSAVGLTVRKSNVLASLGQFVSGLGMHPGSLRVEHCFSTFGKVVCQLSRGTKLSLLCLHQIYKSSSQQMSLGALAIPVRISKRAEAPETSMEISTSPTMRPNTEVNVTAGSIALMLESELDESTKIGGWVEMQKSNPRHLQWAVTMSDTPENEIGWGLSLGGIIQGPSNWDHFQAEGFLKFNIGERFSLQPGLVYVMNGTSQVPALMFRSSWVL